MIDLRIDLLRVRVENGAGHEHRIGPITMLAAAILAERVDERLVSGPSAMPSGADHLVAAPVSVNLAGMSDDDAAHRIASAWLAALTPRPGREWTSSPEGTHT